MLVFLQEEGLLALDSATGDECWSFAGASGMSLGEPAVAGSTVYAAGSLDFYALDAESGDVRWQLERTLAYHSPTVAGDVIYVPSAGDFYAHDVTTGAEVWVTQDWGEPIGGATAVSGPVIVGGRIFFYADGGRLVALGDAGAPALAGL